MMPLREAFAQAAKGEPLPDEAQCAECHMFDITHPDVLRIVSPEHLHFAKCRCRERLIAEEQFRRQQANLPKHLGKDARTFANFRTYPGTQPMVEACKRFVVRGPAEAGHILLLVGPYGVGKSHMLEAIGRESLDKGWTVRYEVVASLLRRLQHCYRHDTEEDIYSLLLWYERMNTLLLDDLGMERGTDWAREMVTSIVDERLRNGRATVIATNCSRGDMETVLGGRLASRLYGDNVPEVVRVEIQTTDYRA